MEEAKITIYQLTIPQKSSNRTDRPGILLFGLDFDLLLYRDLLFSDLDWKDC